MADDPAGVFDEGIIGQRGITLVALEFLALDLIVKPHQANAGAEGEQTDDAPQEQQARFHWGDFMGSLPSIRGDITSTFSAKGYGSSTGATT